LYGYETWLLTVTEENRLEAFDNKALRKTSVYGGKQGSRGVERWRNLHEEELHNFQSSLQCIRMIK
jgi:hypothetical protein